MKVIFMDIDGVLNNEAFFNRRESSSMMSKDNVSLFNELVYKSGAVVVVSSSWKIRHTMIEILEHLKDAGFQFPERVIGFTPILSRQPRWKEITLWLRQVGDCVENFVVLDDFNAPAARGVIENLVKTNPKHGLSPVDLKKAFEILGVKLTNE